MKGYIPEKSKIWEKALLEQQKLEMYKVVWIIIVIFA
jgi:hypothetical protein